MGPPQLVNSSSAKKILSVRWESQAATLVDGNPNGPIVGSRWEDKIEQQWYIQSYGPSSYVFRSAAGDVYANVFKELDGVPILGFTSATNWAIVVVDPITSIFRIQSQDGVYTWVLESGDDGAAIVLRPTQLWENKHEAQWKILDV